MPHQNDPGDECQCEDCQNRRENTRLAELTEHLPPCICESCQTHRYFNTPSLWEAYWIWREFLHLTEVDDTIEQLAKEATWDLEVADKYGAI